MERKVENPCSLPSRFNFYLRGKGIPVHGRRSRGDQIVKIKLDIPTKLSERQKWLIKELDDTENT